jgi:nitroreductase
MKAKFERLYFDEKSPEQMIHIARTFYRDMQKRRSVRDFSDRPVPAEVIIQAIKSAGTAPSGANLQPWHFVLVADRETKRKIREGAEQEEKKFYGSRATDEWLEVLEPLGTDEHKPFLDTAPCLIVIFLKKYLLDKKGKQHKTYYAAESVGIAAGMLITALHLSGLVTLTHTPSPMGFLNVILKRPVNEKPFLILVTGYPAKNTRVPVISKQPFDQITSFSGRKAERKGLYQSQIREPENTDTFPG